MSVGMQVFRSDGVLAWDSNQMSGGIVADVISISAASTGTYTFPSFPGRQVRVVTLANREEAVDEGVTYDTALGYPRVTVAASGSGTRRFMVVVY